MDEWGQIGLLIVRDDSDIALCDRNECDSLDRQANNQSYNAVESTDLTEDTELLEALVGAN